MDNDSNDKSLSQEINRKSQRLPIYTNELRVLNALGQIQATDEKNNRYVHNLRCSSCMDTNCDFIYKFEKFNNITSKLSKNKKLEIFTSTLQSYFQSHHQDCKTKKNVLAFLEHYKVRNDMSTAFTPIDEATARYLFQLTENIHVFDKIRRYSKKLVCLNILELEKSYKIKIFCCNCRFEATVNTLRINLPTIIPQSLAVHNCETGSQMIPKKRNISDVVPINKENELNKPNDIIQKLKKQRINPNKKQINIMDILKKKKIKDYDKTIKKNNAENEVIPINEQESRLQRLSPSDFGGKRKDENLLLGTKNKNAIINNRSVSAGGALTLKKPTNPSAQSRSVSENKFGIDLSLLFDSEEEDVVETKLDKFPAELDFELSSSENNPTKQGDLLGQLDLDFLDESDIEPEEQVNQNEPLNINNHDGSTYAPKIKEENNLMQPLKKLQKSIPLSSATLKHVQDVSRITNDSDSLPNSSKYTHKEIIQSRVISDIPVDFGKIQDFRNSPLNAKKHEQEIPEPTVAQRQVSVLENIKSPILKKTRQQFKSATKQHSKRKKYNGYLPQANNIMDSFEDFEDQRNVSLRDASIHSPKRLKKLVLSEEIKSVDENTIRKLSQKDDILPASKKENSDISKVESNASQSPSVIINRPDDNIELGDDGNVSFNIEELRPSTPQKAQQDQNTSVQSDHKVRTDSPIKRPIIMESPVHSEIKKFNNLKSSPIRNSIELPKEPVSENREESDSELLLSFNNNKSVLGDPKQNVLLDLKNKANENFVEILDSLDNQEEIAYAGTTFKEINDFNIKELSLYMARRTLHINKIQSVVDLSLKNEDTLDFVEVLAKRKSVFEDENNFNKSLLLKHYQLQKEFVNDNHNAMMQRIDDCQDMDILINLYNKLK